MSLLVIETARAPIRISSTKKASSSAAHAHFASLLHLVQPTPCVACPLSIAPEHRAQCVAQLITPHLMYCATASSSRTRYIVPAALSHPHALGAHVSPCRVITRACIACDAGVPPRRRYFRRAMHHAIRLFPFPPRESKPTRGVHRESRRAPLTTCAAQASPPLRPYPPRTTDHDAHPLPRTQRKRHAFLFAMAPTFAGRTSSAEFRPRHPAAPLSPTASTSRMRSDRGGRFPSHTTRSPPPHHTLHHRRTQHQRHLFPIARAAFVAAPPVTFNHHRPCRTLCMKPAPAPRCRCAPPAACAAAAAKTPSPSHTPVHSLRKPSATTAPAGTTHPVARVRSAAAPQLRLRAAHGRLSGYVHLCVHRYALDVCDPCRRRRGATPNSARALSHGVRIYVLIKVFHPSVHRMVEEKYFG
ncbi:hypothetical protein C8J57DRAFT_1724134 [Mycena rebaudengoi]|nr:hypothetical protein C8J57DRAFT_1724134 [Mycena rebaudengoi]